MPIVPPFLIDFNMTFYLKGEKEALKKYGYDSDNTEHILSSTTQERLAKYLSDLSDMEVEGIYRYGSKTGKQLAKIECLKRGIIKESFFKRMLSKLK